jgi:hypothetical protein
MSWPQNWPAKPVSNSKRKNIPSWGRRCALDPAAGGINALHASGALPGAAESGGSSVAEDTVKSTTPEQAIQRFEHYELVIGEDGKPVELGRQCDF